MFSDLRKHNFKLLLIFLIPALGMLYFSSNFVYEKYSEYRKSLYLNRIIDYTKALATLVKELQKERGLTIATLNDKNILKALQTQYRSSDLAIEQFYLVIEKNGELVENSESLKKALQLLYELEGFRRTFHSKKWQEVYDFYSGLIRNLLDSLGTFEKTFINQRFFFVYLSFNALLELSEIAGKERALITYLLSGIPQRNSIEQKLKKLEIAYGENKKLFFSHAPMSIVVIYNKTVTKEVQEAFEKVKEAVIYNRRYDIVTKQQWWILATKFIDQIYNVEKRLLLKMQLLRRELLAEAKKGLIISLLLWLGSLAALFYLVRLINKLFFSLKTVLQRAEYEKVFYKTVSQFSEQILFVDTLNTLLNTYAIYLFETGFFDSLHILDSNGNIVVSEGSALFQSDETFQKVINKNISEVKKQKRSKQVKLGNGKQVLLMPLADKDELLFVVVMELKKNVSYKLLFKIVSKMDELFLFSYRYLSVKKKESELKGELEVFSKAFEAHEAITITDSAGNIIKVNKAFEDITGYKEHEVIGKNPSILKSGKHDQEFYQQMWETIKKQGFWKGEIYNKRKDGTIYPELLSISAIKDSKGNITNYIAHFFDISELKKAQDSIEFSANHDLLTEFFNRKRFMEELEFFYKMTRKEKSFSALFYIDMDDFKYINDTYGHDVGDQVLVAFAKRLRSIAKEEDILARLGGDEFAFLAPSLSHDKEEATERAGIVAKKILDTFKKPIMVDDRVFDISLSIGIYLFPNRERNAREVVTNADIAMYYAKRNGKNQFLFFDDKLDHASKEYLVMKNDLERALKEGELFLLYQPKVRIKDNAIIGFEALLRWNHPTKGILTPDRFLFAAKGNRLIFDIGCFVVKEACDMIKRLDYRYPISVNISGDQFNNSNFLHHAKSVLSGKEREARLLEFEIVEDALVKDLKRTKETIDELKKMGIRFSIDDFGIGYSSLNYLEKLNVDVLKIDKSFILNLHEKRKYSIVKLILDTSRIFGMECIAEGVENVTTLAKLKEMGFEYYQGYLFSRPIPQEKVMELVSADSQRLSA